MVLTTSLVKGITNIQDGMVFETVCTDLEGAGYEVRTFNIPAASVGAPHRRERMWIVANRKESMVNPDDVRLEQHNTAEEEPSWWRTSTTFEPTSDVVNANNDGSPATTQPRSSTQTGNNDQEGQNKTSEFKRTSRPNDNEIMANSRRSIRGEQSSRHQESIGSGTSEKTEWSTDSDSITRSSEGETIMADTNESRSRERKISGDLNDEGRRASETRREGLQSEDRETRTDNLGSGSKDVANTQGERTRENDEGLRSGTSRISGRQETTMADTNLNREKWNQSEDRNGSRTEQGSEDVADTESSFGNVNEAVAGNGGSTPQEVSGDGSSVRGESAWWDVEPDVGRVAHGIPGRVYRLKGLGNSIVPQIAQEIGTAIIKAEREE